MTEVSYAIREELCRLVRMAVNAYKNTQSGEYCYGYKTDRWMFASRPGAARVVINSPSPSEPAESSVMTLGTATSRPASASAKMRSWLAMLCVSLFVLSGFVHAIQHVETIVVATVELSAHGADAGDPDSPEKPGVTAEHCCGCASVAYLPVVDADMPGTVQCGVTPPPAHQLAGHTTAYEPPPPKSLT